MAEESLLVLGVWVKHLEVNVYADLFEHLAHNGGLDLQTLGRDQRQGQPIRIAGRLEQLTRFG